MRAGSNSGSYSRHGRQRCTYDRRVEVERIVEDSLDENDVFYTCVDVDEEPPSYDDSQAEYGLGPLIHHAGRADNNGRHSRTRDETVRLCRRTERSKTANDPDNIDAVCELVDDLLRTRGRDHRDSHEPRKSPSIQELSACASNCLFDPATVVGRGESSRHELPAECYSLEPMDNPRRSRRSPSVVLSRPEPSRERQNINGGVESRRDSVCTSKNPETVIKAVRPSHTKTAPPRSAFLDSDVSSIVPSTQSTTVAPAAPPPIRAAIRCRGCIIYKDAWVQEFGCNGCRLSQSTKSKALKPSHPDGGAFAMQLNQKKVRAYHLPVSRENYESERKNCLLCKICYKARVLDTPFSTDELKVHLKKHAMQDIKDAYC